jgi:2,3-bisphosphoglycerate-dependent phosphoglycerate mutase
MSTGTLVILRHGESEWNATGRWTGLKDVSLTNEGIHEAKLLGAKLKDIHFDHAYVSEQLRALETLQAVLGVQGQVDLTYDRRWGINERDYGQYTGMDKWQVKERLGEAAFNDIRRGWDTPVPGGETLKDVYNRVVPFFEQDVLPRLKKGETVLLVSHGNSIRSLIKYIEHISDTDIADVEMIFGTILLYHFDADGNMTGKEERKIDIVLPHA